MRVRFFFRAEDGIRDLVRSRGLGDGYKRQALAGADELVILAASGVRDVDGSGIGLVDEGLVAAVLRSAAERPPAHVTVVSSALGYDRRRRSVPSARSTEVDPFGLPLALRHLPAALAGRVRAERSATSWGDRHRVPVAALRPVLCASLSARGWYDRSGWRVRRVRPSPWPTVQYVHVRDVVAAVETVREGRRRGTYNVAPDDLLDGPTIAELADRHVGIGAPSWVLVALDQIRWSTWWSPTPPSLVQVVSSDLAVDASGLKALGWSASHSSAEAFLVAHAPAWWPSLSARRRQDLVLGGSATILVAIVGGVGWAVTSRWRRRVRRPTPVSYTHLRAHETVLDLVCRLLLEKKKTQKKSAAVAMENTVAKTGRTPPRYVV